MKAAPIQTSKGEATRAAILKAALEQASVSGFEWLTIGSLATVTGLSKSGLFAHFGSKEDLQIATLDEAMRRFNELVVIPMMAMPRGLKRLTALLEQTMTWTARCGLSACPLMMAMHEFDDKTGAVRDAVIEHVLRQNEGLVRSIEAAKTNGELAADTDAEQLSFELFGIISSCYRSHHLFHDQNAKIRARRAFQRLIRSYSPPAIGTALVGVAVDVAADKKSGASQKVAVRKKLTAVAKDHRRSSKPVSEARVKRKLSTTR